MRIMVAGGAGSLMNWVVPRLVALGHSVAVADKSLSSRGVTSVYDFMEGDLCDPYFVAHAVEGADVVVNAAAQVYGVLGFHRAGADILSRDLRLHANLLEESARAGVTRFVYVSSSVVYERAASHAEDDALAGYAPVTEYGLSKFLGERLCHAYRRDYGLPFTIWRPFNIINPFERAGESPGIAHVYADFLQRILVDRQNPLDIIGDGRQVRSFSWIGDVASAIVSHSLSEATVNRTFNIGNDEPVEMIALAKLVHDIGVERGILPRASCLSFNHLPAPATDVRYRRPDITLAKNVLGWTPETSMAQAIERCIEHLQIEKKIPV